MNPSRLRAPGWEVRVAAAMASGIDPMSYAVSSTRLRQVIRESEANEPLKQKLIAYLNRRLIKGKPIVGCVLLGVAISDFAETTDDEDLIKISDNIRDLDKLPYVVANGRVVS